MKIKKQNILLLILPLLIFQMTGCGNRMHTKVTPNAQTTERVFQNERPMMPEYRLGYGDVVEIKFFNNSQFNETVTVRPDGRISMEKIGEMLVADKTPDELGKAITNVYSKIIKNPEVTVIVRNFGGYQVYILGEVEEPGAIAMQRNMTVLQTLAQAGGQKQGASLKSIMLMRRTNTGEVAAKRIDLSGPSPMSVQSNDAFVQANDIIYVPKTFIANVNSFVEQATSGIIKPLDIYFQAAWYSRWR